MSPEQEREIDRLVDSQARTYYEARRDVLGVFALDGHVEMPAHSEHASEAAQQLKDESASSGQSSPPKTTRFTRKPRRLGPRASLIADIGPPGEGPHNHFPYKR
jgi:hypothetical protein